MEGLETTPAQRRRARQAQTVQNVFGSRGTALEEALPRVPAPAAERGYALGTVPEAAGPVPTTPAEREAYRRARTTQLHESERWSTTLRDLQQNTLARSLEQAMIAANREAARTAYSEADRPPVSLMPEPQRTQYVGRRRTELAQAAIQAERPRLEQEAQRAAQAQIDQEIAIQVEQEMSKNLFYPLPPDLSRQYREAVARASAPTPASVASEAGLRAQERAEAEAARQAERRRRLLEARAQRQAASHMPFSTVPQQQQQQQQQQQRQLQAPSVVSQPLIATTPTTVSTPASLVGPQQQQRQQQQRQQQQQTPTPTVVTAPPPGTFRRIVAGNRRLSGPVVRSRAANLFVDHLKQQLKRPDIDEGIINDIVSQWTATNTINTMGMEPSLALDRALDWWAEREWNRVPASARGDHTGEAKAQNDSAIVTAAEASIQNEERRVADMRRIVFSARGLPLSSAGPPLTATAEEREQALHEAQQLSSPSQPSAKRLRMGAAPTSPPGIMMQTAGGQLAESPRPAIAPVPRPISAIGRSLAGGTLPGGEVIEGITRTEVPGGGFLGSVTSGTSLLSNRLQQLAPSQALWAGSTQRRTMQEWQQRSTFGPPTYAPIF